jgi:hypothetical protein
MRAHIDEGFFAADGGIELVLLLGGASLAVVLTGAGASAPTPYSTCPDPSRR